MPHEKVIEPIMAGRGQQFDLGIADVFFVLSEAFHRTAQGSSGDDATMEEKARQPASARRLDAE